MSTARTMIMILVLGTLFATTAPTTVSAQEHDGFFFRYTGGPGYIQTTSDLPGNLKLEQTGLASMGDVALGWSLTPNVIVHASLFAPSTLTSSTTIDGKEIEGSEKAFNTTSVGLGLTYYFMPHNIYISSSIGSAWLDAEDNNIDGGMGYGANIMVGKEWWVSESWGLGVAAQGIVVQTPYTLKNTNDEGDITQLTAGIVFSATYN